MNLNAAQLKDNRKKLNDFLHQHDLDAFYLSGFDPHISEYVPLEEGHRYYVTGFTGSTAEVLALKDGKVRLYVDGRYWEQADKEVDLNEVEVVKVGQNTSNRAAIVEDLQNLKLQKVGFEGDRTDLTYINEFAPVTSLQGFFKEELKPILSYNQYATDFKIERIGDEHTGLDVAGKVQKIGLADDEALYTLAIDQVAWMTNARGYQLPYLSSFMGRAFITNKKVHLILDEGVDVDEKLKSDPAIEVHQIESTQLETKLKELSKGIKSLSFFRNINAGDHHFLTNIFGDQLIASNGLIPFMSIKNDKEIKSLEDSFKRSSLAVHGAITWVKNKVTAGEKITEKDIADQVKTQYEKQGCKGLSFNTIAGVGANGSIIHYGTPSDQIIVGDDMILVDSGAYYEGGFATDKTRTFWSKDNGAPTKKHKEIYTLVLKGQIQCESAVFPEGTPGSALDCLARTPLRRYGYDFNHGTGHGVGVHVHEGGVRISPVSHVPMKEGQIVSVEPGIYIPGFGGVRLENVCVVEKHPKFENMLRMRPLNYIGWEPQLIDLSMLTFEEKEYLEDYEAKCLSLGTSFRNR